MYNVNSQVKILLDDKTVILNLIRKYCNLFSVKIGHLSRDQIDLDLTEDAAPKSYQPRTLPYTNKGKVELVINRFSESKNFFNSKI